MSDNVKKLDWFSSGSVRTDEPPVQESPVEPTPTEEVTEQTPVEEPVETPVTPTELEPVEPTPVVEKEVKKISLAEQVRANKDKVKKFLELEDLDVSSLSEQDALRLKIQSENPRFTKEHVEDEMRSKYGIGLKLHEINRDELDDDEILKLERENRQIQEQIRNGERALLKDSDSAFTYLNSLKDSIELPELQIDEPEPINTQELYNTFAKEHYEELEKRRTEEWIPTLKETFKGIGSIKESYEVEVNGSKVAIDVNYDLTEDEKESLIGELGFVSVSDKEAEFYKKQDGTYDLQRFVEDKSKSRLQRKITEIAIKEGINKALSEFVQKDLKNYTPLQTNRAPAEDDRSPATTFDRLKKIKKY